MTTTSKELALQAQEPSVALMLSGFIERGITAENVAAFSQLVALKERMDDKKAEKDFATDMIALQQELPTITANASVPNDDGSTRYKFAKIEHIDLNLRPVALKHGFTYSFGEAGEDPARVTKICTVTHKGGHSKSYNFTVRIGKGPPKASEAQGDGAAATYAQRRALCDAFGIIVDKDTDGADARILGAKISHEKANEIAERLDRLREAHLINGKAFMLLAQAEKFEDICEVRLPVLEEELTKREAKLPQE